MTNDDGKASGVTIVPYRNITKRHPKFIRSYAHFGSSGAGRFPGIARSLPGFGTEFKKQVRRHYPAPISFVMMGEMLARWENYVEIDKNVRDAWGIPALKIHCQQSDNEHEMAKDTMDTLKALFYAARAEIVSIGVFGKTGDDGKSKLSAPGAIIHEEGTCRMPGV